MQDQHHGNDTSHTPKRQDEESSYTGDLEQAIGTKFFVFDTLEWGQSLAQRNNELEAENEQLKTDIQHQLSAMELWQEERRTMSEKHTTLQEVCTVFMVVFIFLALFSFDLGKTIIAF